MTIIDPADAEPNLSTNPVGTYTGRLSSYKNFVGDGVGGIELMVKHYAGRNGTRIDQQVMDEASHFTWNGFEYDDWTMPNRAMNFATYGDTWIKVYERDGGAEGVFGMNSDDYWGEGRFGGFGVKHRFSTTAPVQHLTASSACYASTFQCAGNTTVDIVYTPELNQPPTGTGGFPSGDLANFTLHGTPGIWSVQSGHLTANTSASQSVALRTGVVMTDGWVETETDHAVDGGLLLRAQNNQGNHYLLAIRDDSRYGHANIQIYKAVNGSYTALSGQIDLSFPRGATKKIRFEATGTSLKAYFGGSLVAQATDATYSSGLIGVRANNSGTALQTRYAVLRWNATNPTDDFSSAASLSNYTILGTPGAWSVTSGHLHADGTARQSFAFRNGVTIENGWDETETDQIADGGLVLRAQNGSNYYLLAIRDDSRFGHANIEIYRALNGTFTPLTSQINLSFPVGTTKTIRFEATGSTLKAYVGGSLVAQASDATFTSGLVGIRANGLDGYNLVSRYDVFRFGGQ